MDADLKKGMPVGIGIDPNSLLDDIVVLECNSNYDIGIVLSTLKMQLMRLTGRVQESEDDTDANAKDDGSEKHSQ